MTKYCFYAATGYLVFVVYGSLVPFDFQSMPWNQALSEFKDIPYLNLGMESRADWIANIVLYIPLAFLWAVVPGNFKSGRLRCYWLLLVLSSCLMVALAIEFIQLYFPPRTVSINDLIAESMGTGIGLLAAGLYGQRLVQMGNRLSLGGLVSIKTLIKGYLLAYLVLSFFPFDFVTSFAEWEMKLQTSLDHFFMPFDACRQEAVRCVVKLLVEIGVLMPVGGLFFLLPHIVHKLGLAILVGFFLGVLSETVQLFLYSGIGQGISIFTRMLGMGLGVICAKWLSKQDVAYWRQRLKPAILMASPPYLLLVFVITGGLEKSWLPLALAEGKLAETRFLPFYYYYYTTETIALASLVNNLGIYIPVGLAFRLWYVAEGKDKAASWVWAGLTALGLAILAETEKLFLADKHPDPTNVGVAFVAAAAAYIVLDKALRWFNKSPA